MTTLLRAIYIFIASALTIALTQGCTDDPFLKYESIPEGNGLIDLNLSFTPDVNVKLYTRTPGDAIKDINDIFIVVYTLGGEKVCTRYFESDQFNVENVDRENNSPVTTTEPSTKKATIKSVSLPYGKYHIYAVANMGNLGVNEYSDEIEKEDDFRKIRFNWNKNNISENNQMSGYFTNNDDYPTYDSKNYRNTPMEVAVSPGKTYLHAWLRRAASKITIDYDASNLNDNIYIYLKNVTIHDIPSSCSLIENNKPTGEGDLIENGESITYSETQDVDPEGDLTYVLSKGHPNLDGNKEVHADSANALFFYENMQGPAEDSDEKMPDKRQDADRDGFLDDAGEKKPGESGWKDDVKGGTYIEVEAYYVSSAANNHGKGQIKYRFMLGKDVISDYNAERNHHYKLTLKFNGNANDVDWHIEYEEEDNPGIYTPVYYVSYRYNEPDNDLITGDAYWDKCYPIRLAGDDIGEEVEVRIVENNWGTGQGGKTGDSPGEYDNSKVKTVIKGFKTDDTAKPELTGDVDHTGVWHGFLSLYKQEGEASLGTKPNEIWGRFSAGEYIYWYSRGQKPKYVDPKYGTPQSKISKKNESEWGEGYRKYSTSPGVHKDDEFGDYKVEVTYRNGVKETTLYIPLYTRPLIINQKKGFSGMNPYFSYQRYAKLKINATINGSPQEHFADVYQVRRVINPKGVFRTWNNTKPFTVDLSYRISETAGTNFTKFTSIGPWRAKIIKGSGWRIVGKSSGASGSRISVTVEPTGNLEDESKTACAMLLIEYHDYKCVHYVHLRRGYAPIQLISTSPSDNPICYWHTFNVSYVENATSSTPEAVMSHGPLDAGSMFRYGNLNDAIDLINNTRDRRDKTGSEIYAVPDKGFFIGPIGNDKSKTRFLKWNKIPSYSSWGGREKMTYDGANVRIPVYDDFNDLRDKKNVDYGYGLCYGDGATEIGTDDETVFFYSRYNQHGVPDWIANEYPNIPPYAGTDQKGENAVRGCFVYNRNDARVIFLPLGASSYGRRKAQGSQYSGFTFGDGALHYGDFDKPWDQETRYDVALQAPFVPAIFNLYSNYGACYWLSDKESLDDGPAVAWDLNYTTIDFAPIYDNNLHVSASSGSDACLLRLVQDDPPTLVECKRMTKRIDDFIKGGKNVWPN